MEFIENKELTPYPEINGVLASLSNGLPKLLGDQLVGVYLTGSLTYGDFEPGSSDIDFLAVLTEPLSAEQLEQVKALHQRIGSEFPIWAERTEGSYIPQSMLSSVEPPTQARPYFNRGNFHDYQYGNEWLLNLYVIHECGVALIGPDPKELFPTVDIEAVREASRRDLHADWESKLTEPHPFEHLGYDTNHLQTYAVLTMCRILHRAKNDDVASKRVASAWVKETYGEPWKSLVEKAEQWEHGKQMNAVQDTLDFIRLTLKEVG